MTGETENGGSHVGVDLPTQDSQQTYCARQNDYIINSWRHSYVMSWSVFTVFTA